MDRKSNIRAVAAAAGVSPATASRVLNGNPRVDPALTEKVLAAARALGYRQTAQRGGLTRNIVFVVPSLGDTYYASVVDGMVDAAAAHGMGVTVLITHADAERELECLRTACASSTAGIVFTPTSAQDPYEAVPALRSLPLVITGPRLQLDGASNIYLDGVSTAYIATRYLLRLGHRNIVFLANFWRSHIRSYEEFMQEYASERHCYFSAYDRYDGFCQALAEEGLSPDPALTLFGGFSYESGYAAVRQLLGAAINFDAILAPNDRVGAGAMRMLREQGLRVPEQVSILCLNGSILSELVSPTLTSMEAENPYMGAAAVDQILKLQRGGEPESVRIPASLNIRGSTAALG